LISRQMASVRRLRPAPAHGCIILLRQALHRCRQPLSAAPKTGLWLSLKVSGRCRRPPAKPCRSI